MRIPVWTDHEILARRSAKNVVRSDRPYAFFNERECAASGKPELVSTVFLTNRECPFRCLMCDLWKNTTNERVPRGAIVEQIDYALSRLDRAEHLKLYNSGNFFDRQAIPPQDLPAIVQRANRFRSLIVENHPRLCGTNCVDFSRQLDCDFEIALGLETTHPEVLPALNKQMTLDDFRRATQLLASTGIRTRAFILLKPPFLRSDQEALEWALKSIEFAFDCGVELCAVIPTRAGNGAMDVLLESGQFSPPKLETLEACLREGLRLQQGRVTVDLWDLEKLIDCEDCGQARRERLQRMNLFQVDEPPIACDCQGREAE